MINKRPIFEGNSLVEQLVNVIEIKGLSKNDYSFVKNKELFLLIKNHKFSFKKLDDIISCADKGLIKLLKSLLIVNPAQRIKAIDAINSDFINSIRDYDVEDPISDVEIDFPFDR